MPFVVNLQAGILVDSALNSESKLCRKYFIKKRESEILKTGQLYWVLLLICYIQRMFHFVNNCIYYFYINYFTFCIG